MVLMACDQSVIYTLLFLSTGQTLEMPDRLQKLLFSVADHFCCRSENELDVYAMGIKLSAPSPE